MDFDDVFGGDAGEAGGIDNGVAEDLFMFTGMN